MIEIAPESPEGLLPSLTQVIEPSQGWVRIDWREVWRYRELLYFLTWRDVKIRYKQTALGAAWAVLQPVMYMVVFTLFFGKLAGFEQKTRLPYHIYVFAGLLPWNFFASAINNSSGSLVGSANLITKVYFPRLIIPLSAVCAGLVDLAVALGVLLLLMAVHGIPPTWLILTTPALLLGMILAATGVGSLLSALTVTYRDFRYVVPFLVQVWFFVTPVIFPVSIVPEAWRWVLSLNPMYGLIEGFRAAFLAQPVEWPYVGLALGVSLLLFLGGAAYFRSVERRFADVI